MTYRRVLRPGAAACLLAGCCLSIAAAAADFEIRPPVAGTWVLDGAGMISDGDAARIVATCNRLYSETNRPLYAVTIDSMAAHGHGATTIERFARKLYEQWGADPGFSSRGAWRGGVLLLVSKGDRKARIELGADWGGAYDSECGRIMDQTMVPAFKHGDFSSGIEAGVAALDQMARNKVTVPAAIVLPAQTANEPITQITSDHPIGGRAPLAHTAPIQMHSGNYRSVYGSRIGSAWVLLLVFVFFPILIVYRLLTGLRGSSRGISNYSFDDRRGCRRSKKLRRRHRGSLGYYESSSHHGGHHGHSGGGFGGGGGATGSW